MMMATALKNMSLLSNVVILTLFVGTATSFSPPSSSAVGIPNCFGCVRNGVCSSDVSGNICFSPHFQRCHQKVWMSTTSESHTKPSQSMTVAQLKDLCREKGLRVSGTKGELLERLITIKDTKKALLTTEDEDGLHSGIVISKDSDNYDDEINSNSEMSDDPILRDIHPSLLEILTRRLGGEGKENDDASSSPSSISFLPIQTEAYPIISSGDDAILHAPTGSGKTLAYVLPLTSSYLLDDPKQSEEANKKKKRKAKHSAPKSKPIKPTILVIVPSRELSKQVGKVWSSYYPTGSVAAVFGGAPIERHSSLVRRNGGAEVLISTPGRLGELIKDKHVDVSTCKAIVLDEADVLLDFGDQPEVQRVLDYMKEDYQLVLVSATIGEGVKDFAWDIMEMEEGDGGFLSVGSSGRPSPAGGVQEGMTFETDGLVLSEGDTTTHMADDKLVPAIPSKQQHRNVPIVHHWTMPVKTTARCSVISDLISTHNPRVAIVFVQTKAESEYMAADLSSRLGRTGHADVRALHGDMVQAQRSRVMAALSAAKGGRSHNNQKSRVVVATDVASRGIDVPGIDLVVQCGVPRLRGKEGTTDAELYRHRAGRAGRMGGDINRDAHSVLLFDPLGGESKLIPKLTKDLTKSTDIDLTQRFPPTSLEVMDAAFDRATERIADLMESDNEETTSELVDFFLTNLMDEEESGALSREDTTKRLACAMAALSGLNRAVPIRSLLTAEPKDRTVRVYRVDNDGSTGDNENPLTPPEVTRFCKEHGSGKMGRVTICDDGSAVFDLPAGRAEKLFDAARSSKGMHVELPLTLPLMFMYNKSNR